MPITVGDINVFQIVINVGPPKTIDLIYNFKRADGSDLSAGNQAHTFYLDPAELPPPDEGGNQPDLITLTSAQRTGLKNMIVQMIQEMRQKEGF